MTAYLGAYVGRKKRIHLVRSDRRAMVLCHAQQGGPVKKNRVERLDETKRTPPAWEKVGRVCTNCLWSAITGRW